MAGCRRPVRIPTIKSVPPASRRDCSPFFANSAKAADNESGAV
jgi:hypothetical protein